MHCMLRGGNRKINLCVKLYINDHSNPYVIVRYRYTMAASGLRVIHVHEWVSFIGHEGVARGHECVTRQSIAQSNDKSTTRSVFVDPSSSIIPIIRSEGGKERPTKQHVVFTVKRSQR